MMLSRKGPIVGSFSSLMKSLNALMESTMQIYLARNNQQAGPYSLDQVNQMLANGQVVLSDLAWHEGMPEWKILGDLTAGKQFYQPVGYATPLDTPWPGRADANPNHGNNSNELASINQRFLAKVVDGLLWFPMSFIPVFFIDAATTHKIEQLNTSFEQMTTHQTEIMALIPDVALWAMAVYAIVLLAFQAFLLYRSGQTVGKKVMNIRIVDDQNGKITNITRSFLLRTVVFILAYNIIYLFFIVDLAFLFTDRHRTLHDRLARTIVVRAQDVQLEKQKV